MIDFIIKIFLPSIPVVLFILLYVVLRMRQRQRGKYSPFVEKTLRPPAHSLGYELDDLRAELMGQLLILTLIGVIFLPTFMEMKGFIGRMTLFSIMVMSTFYFGFKVNTLINKLWQIKLGYEGELYVGQELNLIMRQGAWVFHDVPYKYGNIDHIVISTGGVFAIETKAVRKPASQTGRAESRVFVKNDELVFPNFATKEPLTQAQRHADYLAEFVRVQLGLSIKVTPVVALPGWFVEHSKSLNTSGVLVINPKRGQVLTKFVNRKILSDKDITLIAARIESFARTIQSSSDVLDPDGSKKFDFWSNRKVEEPKL